MPIGHFDQQRRFYRFVRIGGQPVVNETDGILFHPKAHEFIVSDRVAAKC